MQVKIVHRYCNYGIWWNIPIPCGPVRRAAEWPGSRRRSGFRARLDLNLLIRLGQKGRVGAEAFVRSPIARRRPIREKRVLAEAD